MIRTAASGTAPRPVHRTGPPSCHDPPPGSPEKYADAELTQVMSGGTLYPPTTMKQEGTVKVDRVSFTQRYSASLSNGGWRTMEMGAEASVDEGEDVPTAQRELAAQIRAMFREEWERGRKNSQPAPGLPPSGPPAGSSYA